jgi:hypothetical protein
MEIYIYSLLISALFCTLQYKLDFIQPKIWNTMPELNYTQQVFLMIGVTICPVFNTIYASATFLASCLVWINNKL